MEQVEIERGSRAIFIAIQNALEKKEGCLIGRFGTIELESILADAHLSEMQAAILERNAGIFPQSSAKEWQIQYTNAVKEADILATGWYAPLAKAESSLLQKLQWSGTSVKLRSLEPYYVDPALRWSNLLINQDVCVVSSFTDTASKQVDKLREIWSTKIFPSSTRWHWVKSGYAPVLAQGRATWLDALGEDVTSWKEAVDFLEEEVLATGASIILLGCGGLAMVLGHRLKAKGKICLVLGGAIQVLFGIKGGRWKTHSVIQSFWNDAWVWPSLEETPRGANDVERACYWKPS